MLLASGSVEHLPGAEVIDVDRSWEPIAWLASPIKRIEQEHNTLLMSDMLASKENDDSLTADAFEEPEPYEPSAAVKESLKRVDGVAHDLILVAIEGRTENYEERLNFGLGAAAVFTPKEVAELHGAMAAVSPEAVDQQYNPELMDRMGVFPAQWIEEGRDLMENYIKPNFLRLQSFYAAAAQDKQTVVVWYV